MADHFRDYFASAGADAPDGDVIDRVRDPGAADRFLSDYWGGGGRAPLPIDMPDAVPWTIQTAEETATGTPDGVDEITPREGPPQNPAENSGLAYPPHVPPGPEEVGYGQWGAPAPLVRSMAPDEQRVVLAVAERLVAETRALLVQVKPAENAHFETWSFADGKVIEPTQIGYRHPNGLGYLILASATGLLMGEDQQVGNGSMGIPVPISGGTTSHNFVSLPTNGNLWVSSAGATLSSAVDVWIVQLIMGTTTL